MLRQNAQPSLCSLRSMSDRGGEVRLTSKVGLNAGTPNVQQGFAEPRGEDGKRTLKASQEWVVSWTILKLQVQEK